MKDIDIIGKAYRIFNEAMNKWERYSFWTKASDVEMDDGQSVQQKITSLANQKQDKLTNPLVQEDIVNSLTSTASNKPLSAAQGKTLNDDKQNKTDNSLDTTSKTVVGSINELLTKTNDVSNKTNAKVKVNNINVTSINFAISGNTLIITTS